MKPKESNDAVTTAAERLRSIESWSRRTACAATVAACALVIIAGIAGYVLADYLRLRREASTAFEGARREMAKAFRPAPKVPF